MKTRAVLFAIACLIAATLAADEVKCNQPSGNAYSYSLLLVDGFTDANGQWVTLWSELSYSGWIDKCGGHHTTAFGWDCSLSGGDGGGCPAWRMIQDGWLPPDWNAARRKVK